MNTALVLRHVSFEGLAGFRAPIEAAGYALDTIDATIADFAALDPAAPDLVVVLGGPMGVYDQADHPWLAAEIAWLAARLRTGRPLLGICLGAQLIAAAAGARVHPGPAPEVGFAPVTILDPGSPLCHLAGIPLLHWHGDTFDLPPGATLLASTTRYPHQAFALGCHTLALQFHPEMGEDDEIEAWIDRGTDFIAAAGSDPATIRRDHAAHGRAAVAAGRAMLAEWLENLSDGRTA